MIRVLLVDDHPALRAGLGTVLRLEPGLIPVGAAADAEAALEEARRRDPNVVLVDYHLPGDDGLMLCRRLKELDPAPRVLIYSADADASLAVPATLAGADGLANKAAPADELLEAIRIVAKGTPLFPPISPDMIEGVASRLPWGEQMVFELLMERMPDGEIAARLGLEAQDVAERVRSMLARLRASPVM
jgi:DNA-binding NarL/FixJ family response regulator